MHIFISRFSSLSSLQDHVNRRIIVLKYNCYNCPNEDLTFYNRCSLLLHARLHFTENEGQINLSEVNTFALPLHLAGFLPIADIPTLYECEEDAASDDIYFNVQFYAPNILDHGKQVIILKPTDFVYKEPNQTLVLKQICKTIPKCRFITAEEQLSLKQQFLSENETDGENANIKVELFDYIDQITLPIISKVESLHEKTYNIPHCLECKSIQKGTMAKHYQGNNKPTDPNLTCPVCKFVASTKCSFKAHIRIHNAEAPHVCPDCGKDFEDSEKLQKHLDDVCFHLAKNVKFRCAGKRCGKLFASETNLALHFKQHFQCVCTCTVCSGAFSDNESVEKHIVFHNGNCSFERVFNCSLCVDKGPLNENEFNDHLDSHIDGTRTGVYVYMCRHCRNYFRSTATFATHLLKCNSKHCTDAGTFPNCDNCKNHNYCEARKSFGFCIIKSKRSVKKSIITIKKYFCILCSEQIQLENKLIHMKKCRYACPVILLHKISDKDLNISFGSSSSDSFRSDRDIKRSSRYGDSPRSDENSRKKRKKNLTMRTRKIEKDREPDLTADKPIEFDGTYYCKLCDYKNVVRSEFHIHIRSHRDISTSYQCMECGECFVVKPTLIKHLLHFHNVSDYQSYLNENDCYDVNAVKELENIMRLAPGESKEPVKNNQCSVCLAEFEDGATLNTHYRSHGMAFLLKNVK